MMRSVTLRNMLALGVGGAVLLAGAVSFALASAPVGEIVDADRVPVIELNLATASAVTPSVEPTEAVEPVEQPEPDDDQAPGTSTGDPAGDDDERETVPSAVRDSDDGDDHDDGDDEREDEREDERDDREDDGHDEESDETD